jgi:uncharacterized protein (TIGR03083 family)
MLPAEPIAVVNLFPELQTRLLDLLASLSEEQWRLPTVCAGWSVKDVALHLLGGNVSNLSRRRDGLTGMLSAYAPAGTDLSDHDALVAALNAWNEDWVVATRRMSSRVLCQLLAVTGNELNEYYRGLDLLVMGDSVGWIGPEPMPVWVDVAREYTEHWMHQAQMRDATGDHGIREPRLFAPVLAIFMLALPHALRDVAAPEGTRLRVVITGSAGGEWSAMRRPDRWEMDASAATEATATATLDEEDAWRLWTRGLAPGAAAWAIQATGDVRLAAALREMVTFLG